MNVVHSNGWSIVEHCSVNVVHYEGVGGGPFSRKIALRNT